ncbi:MAG: hypothetical protein KAT58_03010 [candidate division Zixibacteria bacterium]|nr:hypothetical protein [candidate division Zixibacteria bacterium]
MKKIVSLPVRGVLPEEAEVLQAQGIPAAEKPDDRIIGLLDDAFTLFEQLARPVAIMAEISTLEFEKIYAGEGRNEPVTPVAEIYPQAECLALFAVTIGHDVETKISELFQTREFALGSLLDAVASAAADRAAADIEYRFLENLVKRQQTMTTMAASRFSPGYCGWHISGQKRLFAYLQPEEIGITLRSSFLMEPLKSVSGVLLAGAPGLFVIADSYPFCAACQDHSCQTRMPTRLSI